jgi:hypothetical protein
MQTILSTPSASVPEDPDFRAVLRAVHLEVAAIVAEFDLGDATLWTKTAEIVSDVVTEASDMAALLAGAPAETPATGLPPVVWVRSTAGRLGQRIRGRAAPPVRCAGR